VFSRSQLFVPKGGGQRVQTAAKPGRRRGFPRAFLGRSWPSAHEGSRHQRRRTTQRRAQGWQLLARHPANRPVTLVGCRSSTLLVIESSFGPDPGSCYRRAPRPRASASRGAS